MESTLFHLKVHRGQDKGQPFHQRSIQATAHRIKSLKLARPQGAIGLMAMLPPEPDSLLSDSNLLQRNIASWYWCAREWGGWARERGTCWSRPPPDLIGMGSSKLHSNDQTLLQRRLDVISPYILPRMSYWPSDAII
jgi:hypothetical protein